MDNPPRRLRVAALTAFFLSGFAALGLSGRLAAAVGGVFRSGCLFVDPHRGRVHGGSRHRASGWWPYGRPGFSAESPNPVRSSGTVDRRRSAWPAADSITTSCTSAWEPTPSACLLLTLILFASLLWPTFFMGVSLPLLARAVTSASIVRRLPSGRCMPATRIGAAVGAFADDLVDSAGRRTRPEPSASGASLNLGCAAIVLPFARRLPGRPEGPARPLPERGSAGRRSRTYRCRFAALGGHVCAVGVDGAVSGDRLVPAAGRDDEIDRLYLRDACWPST